MKITDALEETGKVCHDTSTVGHYVTDVDGALFWFDYEGTRIYKAPVPWRLVVQDIWVPYPYHPTPEKCDCEAHKRLKAFTKRTGEGPEDNDIAWLLFQVCKQEKP